MGDIFEIWSYNEQNQTFGIMHANSCMYKSSYNGIPAPVINQCYTKTINGPNGPITISPMKLNIVT